MIERIEKLPVEEISVDLKNIIIKKINSKRNICRFEKYHYKKIELKKYLKI